ESNWSQAVQVNDEPAPRTPGTVEIYFLSNLPPGTYYVAIKSQDSAGNLSALSNNLLVTIPGSPDGNEFSHQLKFYEVRFYKNDSAEPLPKGKVDFIIGVNPYKDLKIYSYISFTTILGHAEIDKAAALSSFAVMMNSSELDELFNGRTLISQDKIQKIDIEKIHKEMFPNEPDLKYGVMLDANGDVILDGQDNPIPDSSLADYQNGKTIVYPLSYWKGHWPTRFFFNFNTPAVREYAIRYSLMRQGLFPSHALFMDDIGGEDFEFSNTAGTLHYVSSGTKEEQMKIWANYIIGILGEIKTRPDRLGRYNSGIILNNFRDGVHVGLVLLNEIDRQGKYSVFDMMMNENYFWKDGYSGNIEFYLNWTNKLKSHGKELIHAVSVDPRLDSDSDFVEDVWLWLHLVATDETHVYINRAEYQQSMRDYAVYNFPLGRPLESPHKEGNVWLRKYQRGTIRFDVTSGKIDAIQFIPNDTPPVESPLEPPPPDGGSGGGSGGGGGSGSIIHVPTPSVVIQPPLTPAARQALILQLKRLLLQLLQQLLALLLARAG
ncbi:MAG: putative glycoside hydrolase, partial [Candidatus Vogelbacteria bacterium]